jgi:hypothetical protein
MAVYTGRDKRSCLRWCLLSCQTHQNGRCRALDEEPDRFARVIGDRDPNDQDHTTSYETALLLEHTHVNGNGAILLSVDRCGGSKVGSGADRDHRSRWRGHCARSTQQHKREKPYRLTVLATSPLRRTARYQAVRMSNRVGEE